MACCFCRVVRVSVRRWRIGVGEGARVSVRSGEGIVGSGDGVGEGAAAAQASERPMAIVTREAEISLNWPCAPF